jgi:resuscitation-promoting factor RpfB
LRPSIKYGLYGAVLAGLLGGTVAWAGVDKTVTLQIDGRSERVHTVAANVADALSASGYRVGRHDLVAPGAASAIHNGSVIVLKRGRLLQLTVDGSRRDIWVTDASVSQALADLGFPTADFSSVSRDKRLALTPTRIDIRIPKQIKLVSAGKPQTITTTDPTVGDLLDDVGIAVDADDLLQPAAGAVLTNGMTVTVRKVTNTQVTSVGGVPFAVKRQADGTLAKGQIKIITPGRNGSQGVKYAIVHIDGVLTGQTVLSTTLLAPPVAEIVNVGTRVPVVPVTGGTGVTVATRPAGGHRGTAPPAAAVNPGSAQAIARQMLLARGWGSDQFACLVQMWNHESGWRINAANSSGAYGIPQALPGSKMAADGADWKTNPTTQISWGIAYISGRYGTPCGAWSSWQAHGWY